MMIPDDDDRQYLIRVLCNARHVLSDEMPAKEREAKRDQLKVMLEFAIEYVAGVRDRKAELNILESIPAQGGAT